MTITQAEIRLVQKCWFALSNHATSITADFYTELFKRYPEYRQYFRSDMKVHREKLMKMINIIINGIDVWDKIEPEIYKLGKYHSKIGHFTAEDYLHVSDTLIWTMCRYKATEGDEDTQDEETEEAWRKIFALISKTMLSASETAGKSKSTGHAL